MLTRNLPGKLYNGLIGKVIRVEKDKPPVINFGGQIVILDRVWFETFDLEQERVLEIRYQYPIIYIVGCTSMPGSRNCHWTVEHD